MGDKRAFNGAAGVNPRIDVFVSRVEFQRFDPSMGPRV